MCGGSRRIFERGVRGRSDFVGGEEGHVITKELRHGKKKFLAHSIALIKE